MSLFDEAAEARRSLGLPPAPPPGPVVPFGNLLDDITGHCPCAAVVLDSGHCSGCGELVAVAIEPSTPLNPKGLNR